MSAPTVVTKTPLGRLGIARRIGVGVEETVSAHEPAADGHDVWIRHQLLGGGDRLTGAVLVIDCVDDQVVPGEHRIFGIGLVNGQLRAMEKVLTDARLISG